MNKGVFSRDELISHLNSDKKTLREWERHKLLKPDGFTGDKTPFYLDITREKAAQIKKLLDLGYSLHDIQRIIKKIGLPRNKESSGERANLNEFLTVGELADHVGVSPRAIKHWEDKGIIHPDMRSGGGFRLYSEAYIYLCKLIKDLQLFGYSLEEIKEISDLFRDFIAIRTDLASFSKDDNAQKLSKMLEKIQALFEKMALLKEGIQRWEDLLKKERKKMIGLRNQNQKRSNRKGTSKGKGG
jgi:DNA-binding transcriptional MerR regulator